MDRFEPPHGRGRRLDDPKNTVQTGCRGRQPLQLKNHLQSHRCNGILDRFEPPSPQKSVSYNLTFYCISDIMISLKSILFFGGNMLSIIFRIARLLFHLIGVVLSIIILCIDEPGYDPVWIWMVGSLILNAVLIIPIFIQKGED